MIDIKCFHNIEGLQESFPEELPVLPDVGHFICGKTDYGDGVRVELEVKRIKWVHDGYWWLPCIELDVPSYYDSHAEFFQHYFNLVGVELNAIESDGGEHENRS